MDYSLKTIFLTNVRKPEEQIAYNFHFMRKETNQEQVKTQKELERSIICLNTSQFLLKPKHFLKRKQIQNKKPH